MKNIWRVATYHNSYFQATFGISPRLSLSGTPLNEALVSLHEVLPKFQKENKLQKVQCVILTDGEANDVGYNVEIIRPNIQYIGQRRIHPGHGFLRDRKTGNTYKFDYGWHTFTQTLLTNMRDKFPSVNFIGMRVLGGLREEIKVLDLKKESLNDKVRMQKNFIEELELRGKENIKSKETKIQNILVEENELMNNNAIIEEDVFKLNKEVECVTGATSKLRKLGNLKGKISNKVSTITKEHKFFTENTVCPTCDQSIEETFRINRINDAQNKAKELQSGYKELEQAIKEEENRERRTLDLLGEAKITLWSFLILIPVEKVP